MVVNGLLPEPILSYLSYITQNSLSRSGPSGLYAPISFIIQGNTLTDMPTGECDRSNSSVDVPSSQVSLV